MEGHVRARGKSSDVKAAEAIILMATANVGVPYGGQTVDIQETNNFDNRQHFIFKDIEVSNYMLSGYG